MLFEKRRNPDQNPKVSAYEYLKPYSKDPDIYITFTEIPKVGINPKSGFNTPLGIYTYPLKELWPTISHGKDAGNVPYAGKSPYIFILRSKNKKKFVKDMYKDYNSKDYDDDMEKIRKLYAPKYGKKDFENDTEQIAKQLEYDYSEGHAHYARTWFARTQKMSNKDYGYALHLGIEAIQKKYGRNFPVPEPIKFKKNKKIYDAIEEGTKTSKHFNPISSFWNVTRMIAQGRSGKALVHWNKILRDLGYSGFADKSGKGLIHPSEPTQAVFLSKDAFKVEDMILNKTYAKIGKDLFDGFSEKFAFNQPTSDTQKLFDKAKWLLDPVFSDAIISYTNKVVFKGGFWNSGKWVNGTWENGTWNNGTWEMGTWERGIWEHGIWKTGKWEYGTFYDGEWQNGTWEDGTFGDDAEWHNGTFNGGRFFGNWHDGKWKGGEWDYASYWIKGSIWDEEISRWVKSDVSPLMYFSKKDRNK